MAVVACLELPETPENVEISLPGIGPLKFMRQKLDEIPRISDYILQALNLAAPALAPMHQVLRVLDVILALQKCIIAIPKALPFNPKPIIDCITGLGEAIAFLLEYIPPFPYIKTIVEIVIVIRQLCDDMLNYLTQVDATISAINATIDRAADTNDNILLQIGECAQADVQQAVGGIYLIFEGIGKMLQVIANILDIVAAVLPGPAGKKIEEFAEQISSINESASQGIPLGGMPPLSPLVDLIVLVRTVAVFVEQFGKSILGLEFTVPELNIPVYVNG